MRRRQVFVRLAAAAAVLSLAVPLSGCTARQEEPEPSDPQAHEAGTVAIFTPTDGLTISQHTPLNKWQALTPDLEQALQEQGFSREDIHVHTSDGLARQSRDIQDYVVEALTPNEDDPQPDEITLVVAPAVEAGDATRQYGDYVTEHIDWNAEDIESQDGKISEDDRKAEQDAQRLVTALDLAKEAGMRVVLTASTITGFTPDAYVQMSDAERIGAIQAQNIVDKLKLATTSVENPKYVEVMLPRNTVSEDTSDTDESEQETDDFAAAAFRGVWNVLAPYFQDGRALSPSGLLTAETTADDWRSVAFDASDEDAIASELTQRLRMDDADAGHTRVDGIIAMNDYVASSVIGQLSSLGYVGTSADINPSISISGIVGNIAGRKDLVKQPVPDPIKAPEESDDNADGDIDDDIERMNSRWPIVTGYGAYLDIIPRIVDGQQWMTALEDRVAISDDVAQICARLDADKPLDDLEGISTTDINGSKVPTLTEPLVAVSASNLKEALIDPGYITLADAGL